MGKIRIILHEKIIQGVIERCAPPGSGVIFSYPLLLEKLGIWTELNANINRTAEYWNVKFSVENDKGAKKKDALSPDRLQDALSREDKRESGATLELAQLLSMYGCDEGYEEALNNLGSSLENEIQISKSLKKEFLLEHNYQKQFSSFEAFSQNAKYKILILPFRNPELNIISNIGEELKQRIVEKLGREKLGIEVCYHNSSTRPIIRDDAEKICNYLKADIVIWGNHSKTDGLSHQIYFHFIVAKRKNLTFLSKGKTDKFELERIIDFTEGNYLLEIDKIINWVGAITFYLNKEPAKALPLLNEIECGAGELIFLGICYEDLGNISEALICYRSGLNLAPNFYQGNLCYASIHHFKLRDYITAEAYYKKVIEIYPNCFDAHYDFAVLLLKIDQLGNALKHFECACSIYPDYPWTYLRMAEILIAQKKFEQAKNCYVHAITLEKENAFFYAIYASFLWQKLNDVEGSKKEFSTAFERDPNNSEVCTLYADFFYHKLKQFEEAASYYERALEIDPKSFRANVNFGCFLADKFLDYKKAYEHFKIAYEIEPEDESIQINLKIAKIELDKINKSSNE